MQVLNGGDFDQKNVLIGGTGKTESFGVTNDPVLMGMLSTGLYQKPMRTMIQEMMFNAWDAHRMGNCQDKAIDIYINDTSGLVIRDYGPGIHKNEIHPIYCIYGNSTKRDNDELTGGFGLGSKSPYAYADSFTVTSHHEGFKGMYVMNRVSEENKGGPGRSIIFEDIPTPESGLVVTIPLKNNHDMLRAYEYIKDILYLSGIKARIHFKDETPEEIFSKTIPAGEWIIDQTLNQKGKLFAIYGGVRYEIPKDDAYKDEFNFIEKMSNLLGNIYIGFKASTLTPLPSREGLNLNDRTTATIKNQFEVMEENFRQMLYPVTRVLLNESFKSLCESGIEPKFLVEAWSRVGKYRSLKDVVDKDHPVLSNAKEQCIQSMNQSMWNSLCDLIFTNTENVVNMVGKEKFYTMKYITWAKKFSQHCHYKDYIMDRISTHNQQYKIPSIYEVPISIRELITAKKLCDIASNQDTEIRVSKSDGWQVVQNIRRAGKLYSLSHKNQTVTSALLKENKLKFPTIQYLDRLWLKKTGKEYKDLTPTKTVILAKTITALKNTEFKFQAIFAKNYPNVTSSHNFHRSNFHDNYNSLSSFPIAAIIVNQRNGGYDNALKTLKENGYTVHEANEPESRTRTLKSIKKHGTTTTKEVISYPLINLSKSDWADWSNLIEDPTCYLCITEHKLKHGYSYQKPNTHLIKWVAQNTPRLVILHNKGRANRLETNGIMSFKDMLHKLVEKLLSNQERTNKLIMHYTYKDNLELPKQILDLPEVQKFFKVPFIRNSEKEKFISDMNVLTIISKLSANNDDWIDSETIQQVKNAIAIAKTTDSVFMIRNINENVNLFSNYALREYVSKLKPGEIKCFSEKLLRFLRTV